VEIGPEKPAAVWHACHHNSRCKQARVSEFIQGNLLISQRVVAEKFTIGLAGVSELLAALSHSRPGSSSATTAAIQNSVPHPTCSLDVAPSGFWLFAALKKCLR
jgi:hypothetical protein